MENNGLPEQYVEQYFYQYVGYPKARSDGRLNGGCPICREDSSWGKKSRFWYDPSKEGEGATMKCWNCGYSSSSIKFIAEVTGFTFKEIHQETRDYDIVPKTLKSVDFEEKHLSQLKNTSTLPENSINLFDDSQVEYYNHYSIIQTALDYIKSRNIDKAVNRPKKLFISLDDYTHKNRLIIPYYVNGKILWYQSRKLLNDDSPKYLSKADSSRPIFNFDKIDPEIPYIFVFEGAIDSMFVKNGTCLSGISEKGDFTLTKLQKEQLSRYPFHEIIYVLDSSYLDETANTKTKAIVNAGYKVFHWPESVGMKFKDFNEMAMALNKYKIPESFILKNLHKKSDDAFAAFGI